MTKDDIIRIAKKAGFKDMAEAEYWHPLFKRFAALVAAHEREECAKVCESLDLPTVVGKSWDEGTIDCAKAIRARGQA
jgi:glycine/D-amino acid oxidase-like deaminating enzyme